MTSTSCHFWLWTYGSILCMARKTITTLWIYLNFKTRSFSLMLGKKIIVPSNWKVWFLNSASNIQFISLFLSVNLKARPSVKENLFSIRKAGDTVSTALACLCRAEWSAGIFVASLSQVSQEKSHETMFKISDANKTNKIHMGSFRDQSKQEGKKKEREQGGGEHGDLHNEASSTGVRWACACSLLLYWVTWFHKLIN